jgi:hypothetical protein
MLARPILTLGALLLASLPAQAQQAPPAADPFDWMDGVWRGEADVVTQAGRVRMIQTERSGEMLGGVIRVVEGKGYTLEGVPDYNAFGIISAKAGGGYEMRSWAQGQTGVFDLILTGNRVAWEIPAGPARIRYEAWLEDGKWVEVGHRLVPGQPPVEILRMVLTRIGDTDWPAAGVAGPR